MKKFLFSMLVLSMLVGNNDIFAQEKAYQKGVNLLNIGINFANYNVGLGGLHSMGMVPLQASFELGIHDNVSIGPYIGYTSWKYTSYVGNHQYTNQSKMMFLGARASWHYLPLLNEHLDSEIDESKWDLYATLQTGLRVGINHYQSNDPQDERGYTYPKGISLGPMIGVRYMFTEKVGGYIEGGLGLFGLCSLGISAKL